jgi:hypothetical protein
MMHLEFEEDYLRESNCTRYKIRCPSCRNEVTIMVSEELRSAMIALSGDTFLPPPDDLWERIHETQGDLPCWMVSVGNG